MSTIDELRRLALARAHGPKTVTPIARFEIMRLERPTTLEPVIYDPSVCLILQGSKRAIIGKQVLRYGAGDYFVAAVEVAAMGQIAEATAETPYLALNLRLDPQAVAAVLIDMPKSIEPATPAGFVTSIADGATLDAWLRLLSALDRPDETAILAPMIEREILFRLMLGRDGALLRQIAGSENRLANIRQAMSWIRSHFAEPIRVQDLAAIAGMSTSVFHKHFKSVTALSPIQYQKQIRLHEARARLARTPVDAASVAFSIGYESASQFSREYKRMFGSSPARDARQMRAMNS